MSSLRRPRVNGRVIQCLKGAPIIPPKATSTAATLSVACACQNGASQVKPDSIADALEQMLSQWNEFYIFGRSADLKPALDAHKLDRKCIELGRGGIELLQKKGTSR
jgi:hypothetical protein